MDKIMALRKEINATYEKEGVKLSVNDFVIKAVALACKRVPECNSAWMETFIRWHKMLVMILNTLTSERSIHATSLWRWTQAVVLSPQ